jgi:hypothetical protein
MIACGGKSIGYDWFMIFIVNKMIKPKKGDIVWAQADKEPVWPAVVRHIRFRLFTNLRMDYLKSSFSMITAGMRLFM